MYPRLAGVIIKPMATIHLSQAEAARDFAALLRRVRSGAEIVIENGSEPIAILHAATPPRRSLAEVLALLPEDSDGVIDADFARDVELAVEAHREPLDPPS